METVKSTYADVELRILPREEQGYPIEITLDFRQPYPRGYLAPDLLPWVPGIFPAEDGRRLFDLLLADLNLREAWAEVRGACRQRRLRLRIDVEAPELHALPWELLHDRAGFLAAGSDTPFSRYLAVSQEPARPLTERPVRILVAIANPGNLARKWRLQPLDVMVEQKIVAGALCDLTAGQAELTPLEPPVSLSRLERELRDGYDVLHLVAHGRFAKFGKAAVLFLADNEDQVMPATEDKFAAMVRRLPQKPHLVFLSSCQSASRDTGDAFRGFAPQLLAAGVPAVVAMQEAVKVITAQAFARTFYRVLFKHGLVDLAANQARSSLLTGDYPGSSIPILFSRLHDNRLLAPLSAGALPVIETRPFEPKTIYVPPGPFPMGSQPGDGVPSHETPQEEVDLPAYRIGCCPVTNAQYAAYIHSTGRPVEPELGWKGQRPYEDKLDHPVAGVTWDEAVAYCGWLSDETHRQYHLPTEAQWEKAARGTGGRIYPWGDEWEEGNCHHGVRATAPVDAYPQGASPYGCLDMVGNVREWTSSRWGKNLRAPLFQNPWVSDEREDPAPDRYVLRVCRGGGSADPVQYLRCAARQGYFPDQRSTPGKRVGFRVVMSIGGERQ
jgi:formylglycine-generating enzyme required for sulfatase activity